MSCQSYLSKAVFPKGGASNSRNSVRPYSFLPGKPENKPAAPLKPLAQDSLKRVLSFTTSRSIALLRVPVLELLVFFPFGYYSASKRLTVRKVREAYKTCYKTHSKPPF